MTGRFEEKWKGFKERVLIGCSDLQVLEVKKAFYAGAYALMYLMMNETDQETEEPTENDFALMDEIHNDITEFLKSQSSPIN